MKSILFLVQLPPPTHGASLINKTIKDSSSINSSFRTRYVDISPAKDNLDIGKFSLSKLISTFIILFKAVAAYVKFKPDLVYLTLSPHGLAFYKDGLLAVLLKAFGAKVVFHMHGKGVADAAFTSWLKSRVYRFVFRNVDIIHLSKLLYSDLDGVRDERNSILSVPNGVPAIQVGNHTREANKIVFVYLSNLIKSKGAGVLVRAANLIPKEYQALFQVKIIGKASDVGFFSELENAVARNPYNNIDVLGPRYDNAKVEELISSDVFVLPTQYKNECFPLSVLEAMAAGLAVISTNEGAITEIVESGVNGDIIENCNSQELSHAMLKHIKCTAYSRWCGSNNKAKYEQSYRTEDFENNLICALKQLCC